ncbi:MAG: preprotein translocase subunit YajC [Planctomycetes bacterium]|nr:preprotein translocase subunit YajC [Planctomycetota bacterium]
MKILDCLILAADEGAKPAAKADDAPAWVTFAPFVMIFVVFYFLILKPQSNERRRTQDMLGNLKKNDKVATVGGIVGTVANVSADGKEITLKVDDNTRIKFLRTHIGQVLTDEVSDEKK